MGFRVAEAVSCADGPVRSLVELSWRPSTGAGMVASTAGSTAARSKWGGCGGPARVPLPRAADERLVLAVDVSPWLRPDAPTSAERLFCDIYGRGKGSAQIPRVALFLRRRAGNRPSSWTGYWMCTPEASRRCHGGPRRQIREVVARLIAAGQRRHGTRKFLSWRRWLRRHTAGVGWSICGVLLLGRLRSDLVPRLLVRPRAARDQRLPPRHAAKSVRARLETWPLLKYITSTTTHW